MKNSRACSLVIVLVLSACAGVTDLDGAQNILVQTPGAEGANCVVKNGNGEWQISSTPEMIAVSRSPDPLYVRCLKQGYASAAATIEPVSRGMPWQSLIRGGLFGSKAEEASDSAYEYPALISLSMQAARSTPSSVQDQQVPAKDRTSIAPTPKRMTAEGSPDQIRVSEPPFPKPEQTSKPAAAPKPTKKGPVVRAQPASGPPTKIRSRPQPSARLLDARIGKHEGFIRIVLDLSAESKFTTGFDRDGKVVIRLPGVLAAPGTRPLNDDYFPATALVTTSTPGNGTEITVNASKSVSVKSFDLEPDRIGGHRIVVDLIEAPGTPR